MKDNVIILENVYNKNTYNRLFRELHEHQFSYFWGGGDANGSLYWHSDLKNSSPVQDSCKELFEEFSKKFSININLGTVYINAQTYGAEPGPHYDYHDENSVTVINYITDTWNITWGGETFLFDKYSYTKEDRKVETIQSLLFEPIPIDAVVTPAYNRSIIFPGNKLHCVRALSRYFPGTRYTYMYKLKDITLTELMKNYNAH
jgi:hypothetical protein